jgi:hypothetical protein
MAARIPAKPARHYELHLERLTKHVMAAIGALDRMGRELDGDAGKRIAGLVNALEMSNDHARYFGLGIDFRKDQKKRG